MLNFMFDIYSQTHTHKVHGPKLPIPICNYMNEQYIEDTHESHRHRNVILNYVSGYSNLSREYVQKRRWVRTKSWGSATWKHTATEKGRKPGDNFTEKPVGNNGPLSKLKASVILLISVEDPLEVTAHMLIMNTTPSYVFYFA